MFPDKHKAHLTLKKEAPMKHTTLFALTSFLAPCLTTSTFAANRMVTPKITTRSQGLNAARRMVGLTRYTHQAKRDTSWYQLFSITPAYAQIFKSDDIATCLFGNALNDCALKIEGSRVENRDSNALLADYFYLVALYRFDLNFFLLHCTNIRRISLCANRRVDPYVAIGTST